MASTGLGSEYGISSSLKVVESEQYGRGVYARTTISPGVEVMQAEPFVHVLSNDVREQFCDYCLKKSQSLLKCGQCRFVRYCSKVCQKEDWKCHRGECKGIAKVHPKVPTPLMRMVMRAIQRKNEKQTQNKDNSQWEIELLCSHVDEVSAEVREDLATLMFGVQMMSEPSDSTSMELAYNILHKALCNTFTIHSADLDAVGAGLYQGPSLLNHSCLPNCVAVFSGPTLMIRAIKTIEPGEQLLISYLELLDGREQRRETLRRTYCFQCNCERCLTECNPDSPFHTMYATIGNASKSAAREAVKAGMDCLQTVETHRKKGDWVDMVRECELSLARQACILHHMHHITVQTLQQLIYACIEVGDWSKAIEASQRLTEPLQRYLPRYHPVCAIHLLRQGKLHRLSSSTEHLQLSVRDLSLAVDQLKVVYGQDHPCTQEALGLLHDSQVELSSRTA